MVMNEISDEHGAPLALWTIPRRPRKDELWPQRLTLRLLAERLSRRRMYRCGAAPPALEHGPRVDASAEGSLIGIGGWLPTRGEDGELATSASPWVACQLCQRTAPWAYTKAGQPFRAIAALEALGTLMAVNRSRSGSEVKLDLQWLPRDLNEEADRLSKG